MSDALEIRNFNLREATWAADGGQLSNIRRVVFIIEQNVPQEEEWDGKDNDSWHWLASDREDVPIGTARLLPDGQIGRMAVLENHRGTGVGAALLEAAVEKARHLGMTDVFLNAQSHALGFYEKLGFVSEGDEFDEAGIPHFRMTRTLAPPADNIQRKTVVETELDMAMKPFDAGEVIWAEAAATLRRMRRQVFLHELGLAADMETDDQDESCIHWLAENQEGHAIGALRMSSEGVLGYLMVLDDYRRAGIAKTLLEIAIQRARRLKLPALRMDALADSVPFLEANGFVKAGELCTANNKAWQPMQRVIEPEDHELTHLIAHGESLNEEHPYLLGVTKQLLLLRSESDFRNVILDMCSQARASIRIYSPVLSHDLFDNPALQQVCSRLGRRNKYTRVEILVFDPHRIIKHGHALLSISRKLPSSIGIRIVDPEMRQLNHEFVLADNKGFVYRQEHDTYEGTASYADVSEANRLNRHFTASWESGLLDPNLRQLRI